SSNEFSPGNGIGVDSDFLAWWASGALLFGHWERLFFELKLTASGMREHGVVSGFVSRSFDGLSIDVSLGFDVGYRLSSGSAYVAAIAGFGLGYCVGCSEATSGPFFGPQSFELTEARVTVQGNGNLLRVGLVW